MQVSNKMTPRCWRLYNLIKENTLSNKEPLTKESICASLPDDYKLEINKNDKGGFTNCPAIYNDIRIINFSSEIEKIIVIDNNKFSIGTEEQARDYLDRLRKKAIATLNIYSSVKQKFCKDGAGKLLSSRGDPITDKSKARPFVEAFAPSKE